MKYALAAGEEALALFCGAEAIRHFKYVLDTTADTIEYVNDRAIALEGLGDGLFARARCADATKVFEQLSSSAKSNLVRLRALRKAMYAAVFWGDLFRARELAGKAVENPQLDRLENARVHLNKGIIVAYEKGRKQALQLMEESLRVFEEEYSLPDVAEALTGIGPAYGADGQLENALAAALRSCALTEYMRDLNRQHVAHTYLDVGFMLFGLLGEAQKSNAESFKIAEKVSDPISLAWEESMGYWVKANILEGIAQQRMGSGFSFESTGEFGAGTRIKFFLGSLLSGALGEFKRGLKAAVVEALKGAECAEETDSYYAQALNYTKLTKLYAELEDMEQSEKYYQKMSKLIKETAVAEMQEVYSGWLFSEAVFFSSKRRWKEANQFYEEFLERDRKAGGPPLADQAALRLSYGMALLQQKRSAEAKLHFEEAKRIMDSIEKRFVHSSIQAYLMAPMKVAVGKEFNMRLDLVNVAKNPGLLVKVEGLVPADFKVTESQPNFDVQQGSIEMEKKAISPFRDEAITLTLQATKEGTFNLNPRVIYVDNLGETKTCMPKPVTITAQPAQPAFEVVPGRVSTGFADLDKLLFGGIPENHAMILTSPSNDEREILIKKFLDAGVKTGEITFYITAEPNNGKALAEQYQSNFYLFLCNPRTDVMMQSLPNVVTIKGVESLTDIDIALTKVFRTLKPSAVGTQRICIEIVSDALLQHHAVNTRRWLSALLPTLKSKGFTILAVVDPQMHPSEENQAVLGLFDGEISIYEKETEKGTERFLKIRRLSNPKYLKDEIRLTEE